MGPRKQGPVALQDKEKELSFFFATGGRLKTLHLTSLTDCTTKVQIMATHYPTFLKISNHQTSYGDFVEFGGATTAAGLKFPGENAWSEETFIGQP